MLRSALRHRESITLSVAELGPHGLLTILAEDGASYHVRITSAEALVEVEIGNGIVMGARADRDGEVLQGRAAYVLLRKIRAGMATVEPKRFLSMANVLEPIAALPEISNVSIASPQRSENDTIELVLDAHTIDIPIDVELPPPRRKSRAAPAPRKRRSGIAAGIVLGVSAVAGALIALSFYEPAAPAHAEPILAGAPAIPVAIEVEPEPAAEPIDDVEPADDAPSADPQTLAREARALLRAGRPGPALWRARLAARMRRGAPQYQTLLGDAYAANGQDVQARRAWRRALRSRPGYEPALERLGQGRG